MRFWLHRLPHDGVPAQAHVLASLVAGVTNSARHSIIAGPLLASLPLTWILAMIWVWRDRAPPTRIAGFASCVFWLVLPLLLLFLVMPWMPRAGYAFLPSLGIGCVAAAAAYALAGYVPRLWTRSG